MTLAAQAFDVVAPQTGPLLVAAFVLVVFVAVFGFLFYIVRGMQKASFTVEGDALHVKAPLYGVTVPKSALKLDEAKVVTLRDTPDLMPQLKLNGAAMGGMRVGRFKLKNGTIARVYVTQNGTTLVLPTTEGYTLLLETPAANELLASLKGA